VVDSGDPPVLAEPVVAAVSLRREAGARGFSAWSLTPSGQRAKRMIVQTGPQGISVEIGGDAASIYYELTASSP
jgi:hypothetical protein